MGIDKAKNGKLLYHLTKLTDLESIIQNGLLPRKTLFEEKISFMDIANPEIIDRRQQLGLDAFIPFHFHPYSAFDVAVKNKYPETDFIYICIERAFAREHGFKILPIHPLSFCDNSQLLDYDLGIEQIDWNTLIETGRQDEYAKKVKMAECLTDIAVIADCFQQIVVENEIIKEKVQLLFHENNKSYPPPYINLQPKWFSIN